MAKSVATTVARWKAGANGASQAYIDGIQSTQVDVMARAIAAGPDAVRNYNEAWASGRVARAITESGGTANWKAQSAKKAPNYLTGIQAGEDKAARAFGKLIPAIESLVSSLPARQPGNVAANVNNRVLGLATALHARKGEFKG